MAALPYIQLYVADYLADTAHLSAAQHGAYLLLIFNYWQRGHELSNIGDRLANIARMSDAEWAANKDALAEFFEVTGDTWRHSRIEADLAAVAAKSTRLSTIAKAAAERRASTADQKPGKSPALAKQKPGHTEAEAEAEAKKCKEQGKSASSATSAAGTKVRATYLPATWAATEADIAYCREHRPDLDPVFTAERFRDYWCAIGGDKGRKTDWAATWRNWVRDEKRGNGPRPAAPGQGSGAPSGAKNPAGLGAAGLSTHAAAQRWLGKREQGQE